MVSGGKNITMFRGEFYYCFVNFVNYKQKKATFFIVFVEKLYFCNREPIMCRFT